MQDTGVVLYFFPLDSSKVNPSPALLRGALFLVFRGRCCCSCCQFVQVNNNFKKIKKNLYLEHEVYATRVDLRK